MTGKNYKLFLAPVKGITDSLFRRGFVKYFGGVDRAYAPFVKTALEVLPDKLLKDLQPEINGDLVVVPQILSKDKVGIVDGAFKFEALRYTSFNWNLGCPMATSTKKNLGSGLLPFYDEIDSILSYVFTHSPIDISIKTRLGLHSSKDILKLVPVFNRYPIKEVIIHPRTGVKQYGGSVDLEVFGECLSLLKADVIYNGDICSKEDFVNLSEKFPEVSGWMIGRGALKNPLIFEQIKNPQIENDFEKSNGAVHGFHDYLFDGYRERLDGALPVLHKMVTLIEYLKEYLKISDVQYKKIKKSKTLKEYLTNTDVLWK
ncbi:MAG: tRNA-dihydrouridine synthase family protein [Deltaproteobacteria bacterium]|nr:tRNA-dihydrouridine synthase family protein [Deltaproteobacteria bacterium]